MPAAKSPHHVAAVHGAHAGAGRGVGAGSTAVAAYGINGSGATGSSRTHVSALDLSELQAPLSPEALDHSSRALSQAHVLDSCAVMVCVRVRPMNGASIACAALARDHHLETQCAAPHAPPRFV